MDRHTPRRRAPAASCRMSEPGDGADHHPAERGHPLGVLRAPVRGHEPGLLRRGGAGAGALKRRRRRQGDDLRPHRRGGNRPGRPRGLHLRAAGGAGERPQDLCPAHPARRQFPHGAHRRGLLLGKPPGQDHHRRPQGRRAGDDAGICDEEKRHCPPGRRHRGHHGAV